MNDLIYTVFLSTLLLCGKHKEHVGTSNFIAVSKSEIVFFDIHTEAIARYTLVERYHQVNVGDVYIADEGMVRVIKGKRILILQQHDTTTVWKARRILIDTKLHETQLQQEDE